MAHGDVSLNQKLDVDVVNLPVDKTISGHFCTENPVWLSSVSLYLSSTSLNKSQQPIKEGAC